MKKTISAGGIVLNGDKVLVVSQFGTSWSLPKGHIEDGEGILDAAKREIFEESGIKNLQLIKKLGTYSRHKIGLQAEEDKSELKTIHMFLFKTDEKKLKPNDIENPEARWVRKDKVADILTHKKDKGFYLKQVNEIMK